MNDRTIRREQITGLVLAGGLGTRMCPDGTGTEKGLQTFRGMPMVAHVTRRLAPQVGPLMINANRNVDNYRSLDLPVIGDLIAGHPGPLAGLHAGLRAASTPWLVTAPCDSPFLPLDLVDRLASAIAANHADVAVARVDGRSQPVFMLLRCSLSASVEAFLEAGERKVHRWFAAQNGTYADFDDPQEFRNINTLDELRQFEST